MLKLYVTKDAIHVFKWEKKKNRYNFCSSGLLQYYLRSQTGKVGFFLFSFTFINIKYYVLIVKSWMFVIFTRSKTIFEIIKLGLSFRGV